MDVKDAIRSQYLASLQMMERAVTLCPPALWNDPEYKNKFWHIAYHALFYTHLYLQDTEDDFHPWTRHRPDYQYLGHFPALGRELAPIGAPYTQEEILEYVGICRQVVREKVPPLDLAAASGFSWIPFNKTELQFYNIRHLQHHVGQLADRLRVKADIPVGWVGKGAIEDAEGSRP